jgi:uncharacterized ferritin-like protein (DUF455 family)
MKKENIMTSQTDLFSAAKACIQAKSWTDKIRLSETTAQAWQADALLLGNQNATPDTIPLPGFPDKLALVPPRKLVRRSLHTPEGHAALIHAIAHIEFNAINLAWDAVYRFRHMPRRYYNEWVQIAAEETQHFCLLQTHLTTLGSDYGDFPAHNGLWEMAVKTAHDVMVRMALVPRVLEARGLDVTPAITKKLSDKGDKRAVEILDIILRDEIGHVAVGSYWFKTLCEQRELNSESTFRALLKTYLQGELKPPFHREARLQAGFSEQELDDLVKLCS